MAGSPKYCVVQIGVRGLEGYIHGADRGSIGIQR